MSKCGNGTSHNQNQALQTALLRGGAIALMAIAAGCSSFPGIPSAEVSQSPQLQASPANSQGQSGKTAPSANKPVRQADPKAVALNNQAVSKLSKGDYNGALIAFNQAIKTDAKMAEAYLGRGIAYSELRQRPAAINNYNQAIKLDPAFAEAYLNRADEYATLGKRDEAIADFEKAAQLFSQKGDQANASNAQTRMFALKPAPAKIVVSTPVASTTPKDPKVALAMHLKNSNAKMYGTYWCSVCEWQREQFGKEAFSQITYVECDPHGQNPQPDLCNQARVSAYPTWEINGQVQSPGGYPLQELADISGYKGERDF